MRLLYQLTSPMHLTLGDREIDRRRAFVLGCAAGATEVVVRPIEAGPASIDSDVDVAAVVPELLKAMNWPNFPTVAKRVMEQQAEGSLQPPGQRQAARA